MTVNSRPLRLDGTAACAGAGRDRQAILKRRRLLRGVARRGRREREFRTRGAPRPRLHHAGACRADDHRGSAGGDGDRLEEQRRSLRGRRELAHHLRGLRQEFGCRHAARGTVHDDRRGGRAGWRRGGRATLRPAAARAFSGPWAARASMPASPAGVPTPRATFRTGGWSRGEPAPGHLAVNVRGSRGDSERREDGGSRTPETVGSSSIAPANVTIRFRDSTARPNGYTWPALEYACVGMNPLSN